MGRRHRNTGRAEDKALQDCRRPCPRVRAALAGTFLQHPVDLVPEIAADDRLVLLGIGLTPMDRLSEKNSKIKAILFRFQNAK